MNCPHCESETLVAVEFKALEIDYCPVCEGVWLDAGEIELLYGDEAAAQRFLSIGSRAKVPDGEKPRKCPECRKRMTKESTEGDPPVVFDHCPNGDGMWFDAGELNTVLKHAGALDGDTEVAGFLRDVFPERE